MYQCRKITRNARCRMSTCNTWLLLVLLNSFVFLTSFVLPSGKGHFLTTDHRRKDPKFKFPSRKSSVVSVLADPELLFVVFTPAEASGRTSAWTGGQRRSTWKFSEVFKSFTLQSTNVNGNGGINERRIVILEVCTCMLIRILHVRDFWLALTCVILKNNLHLSSKKINPLIKQTNFIVKQI